MISSYNIIIQNQYTKSKYNIIIQNQNTISLYKINIISYIPSLKYCKDS